MATAEDILITRVQLIGMGSYQRGFYQISNALGIFRRDLDDAERTQLALGASMAVAAVAIVAGLGKATEAAGQHEAVLVRAAGSFEHYGSKIPSAALEEFGNRMQDTTAIARDQAIAIEGLFGDYGVGEQRAKALTAAVLNAAEALKVRGVSAEALASRISIALERARQGDAAAFSRLSQIGIVVNRVRAAADPFGAVIDALNRKGGDLAQQYRATLPGALDAFRNSLTRLGQDVGAYFVGPVTAALQAATRLVDFLDKHPGIVAGAGVLAAGNLGVKAATVIAPLLAAAGGVGATGMGMLRGAGILGGALAAGAISESARGFPDPSGQFAFIGGRAAVGALLGARFGPWGILAGGALGAGEGLYERLAGGGQQQEAQQSIQDLTKSNEDLRASINGLNQKLDQFVGNQDIRDVLGDSRLVAAFARGIA